MKLVMRYFRLLIAGRVVQGFIVGLRLGVRAHYVLLAGFMLGAVLLCEFLAGLFSRVNGVRVDLSLDTLVRTGGTRIVIFISN
jgi:hypothetical protein